MDSSKVTVTSPVASVRFPNLLEHEVFSGVTTGKYSLTLIFKPEDKKVLEDAINSAGGGKGKTPLKVIEKDAQYDAGMIMHQGKKPVQRQGCRCWRLTGAIGERLTWIRCAGQVNLCPIHSEWRRCYHLPGQHQVAIQWCNRRLRLR